MFINKEFHGLVYSPLFCCTPIETTEQERKTDANLQPLFNDEQQHSYLHVMVPASGITVVIRQTEERVTKNHCGLINIPIIIMFVCAIMGIYRLVIS